MSILPASQPRFVPPVAQGYAIVESPEITSRSQFGDLCNRHHLLGRAVEVGVDKAAFAVQFLKSWKGNRMNLIDPWAPLPECPEIVRERESDYQLALAALAPFNWRVEIRRCTSEEAARQCTAPLSFVHLDANKSQTAADIALWWPHIVHGGILAGHDVGPEYPEVLRAVREFACKESLTVYLTRDVPKAWYCYKPPETSDDRHFATRDYLTRRIELHDAVEAGKPLLTLIVPRLQERFKSWQRLRKSLGAQLHRSGFPFSAIEILDDASSDPLARKRQRMLDAARGFYVAFVDDDDRLADTYVQRIASAILQWPTVDVVSFEGHRTEDGKGLQRMHWSLATPTNQRTRETRYIMANHICAMRRELCQQVRFWRDTEYGSDQIYWRSLHVAGLLETEVHLPDDLYHYDFRWNGTGTQSKKRYAVTKATNPHRLYRVIGGKKDGQIAYQFNEEANGQLRVMVADGTKHTLPAKQLESLGEFDVW